MALGIPDQNKKPGNKAPLGIPTQPNTPPANMMGQQPPAGNSVPNYNPMPFGLGQKPNKNNGAPVLPPSSAPIFPDDPSSAPGVQPISFNGGSYNPTTAPYGFDMSAPGVGEQFWNNNQGMWFNSPQLDWVDSQLPQFEDPWAGEQMVGEIAGGIADPGAGQQFWNGVGGSFNSMGKGLESGYGGPNYAEEAYGMTKGMLPGSLQPQFDTYYDRMKDKVMSDVNSQSAARGAYGSNTALNNTIGAGLDVEAQRAKAATDFMLADSANQRDWQGMLGNQGRAADLTGLQTFDSKLKGSQFGLDKLGTFGDLAFKSEGMDFDKDSKQAELAFGMDDQKLERLGAGISTAFNSQSAHRGQLNDAFDAANITQGNREDRVNNLYNQTTEFSNDVMNYVMQNYDNILAGDQASFEAQIQAMLGQTADQRGWDDQTKERIWRDAKGVADLIFKGKEATTPAGAAGGKTG